VDTSILIYHFEAAPVFGALASKLLEILAEGEGFVFSTISLAEILVKPFQIGGSRKAGELEHSLASIPGIELHPLRADISREGARLRAKHGLKLPDALILATALASGAGLFVTNDGEFRKIGSREKIQIALLEDYLEKG
jgi:predicted nucleic acid-binding protein